MGVTLEELLNESGVSSLCEDIEKTASSGAPPEGDIVEQLLKYASDAMVPVKEKALSELAEKTAEIFIIKKTMEEIDKIASMGVTPEELSKLASFVNRALEKGHDSKAIAAFLEKQSAIPFGDFPSFVLRQGRKGMAGFRRSVSTPRAISKIETAKEKELQLLREVMKVNPSEGTRFLNRVESYYGKPTLEKMLSKVKEEGTRIPNWAKGWLPKSTEPALLTTSVKGGKPIAISKTQAKRFGVPVAAAGGGYMLAGRKKDKSSGKNVVVVGG
jgi:hypothetical protein